MKLRVFAFLFFLLLGTIFGAHAEKPALQKGSTRWTGFRGNHGSSHTSASQVYGVAAINGAFLIRTGSRLICVGKP